MRRRRLFPLLLCAALAVSCNSHRTSEEPADSPPKKYSMRGKVVRLRSDGTNIAVIRHDEIKGWMEAMTMEFPVPADSDFQKLREGEEITATVFVRDLDYWIGEIQTVSKPE